MLCSRQLSLHIKVMKIISPIVIEEYLIALLINVLTTMLNLSSPYLIKHIIDFINTDEDRPVSEGLTYVALLVASQSMYYLISEHQDFWQRMIGVKSTNAMISLIYQK